MSSDTANLLREHVKATAELLTNEKPNREETDSDGERNGQDADKRDVRVR